MKYKTAASRGPTIEIIAAVDASMAIGVEGNQLPWKLAGDLARFKADTMGEVVMCGRRTWESILGGLPGRRIIIVSNQPFCGAGVTIASSPQVGMMLAEEDMHAGRVIVIGGEAMYRWALPLARKMTITHVLAVTPLATALFPGVDRHDWAVNVLEDSTDIRVHDFDGFSDPAWIRCEWTRKYAP